MVSDRLNAINAILEAANTRLNPDTLLIALADTSLLDGDALDVEEHTAGTGGGGPWDVVPSGTSPVGPAIRDVFNHDTLPLQLKLRIDGRIKVRQLGAIPNDATTTTVSLALQAAYNLLPAYGVIQNSGAFQDQVLIDFEGGVSDEFFLSDKVSAGFKNNWKLRGVSTLSAGTNLDPDDYMVEFLASSHIDYDELFLDGKTTQKRGIRISGDGFTGTKRNSTNIKSNKIFHRNFKANEVGDLFKAVVVDTLSPNNTFGDWSIDDSVFRDQNFLGCFGSAQRFASSEIILDNNKYSFCSDSNDAAADGVIVLGSGSSLKTNNLLFTETGPGIQALDNASVGRVSNHQMYTEQAQAVWKQTGGTVRALSYTDGYFASLKNAKFLDISNVELQMYMSGNAWQEDPTVDGFRDIDLGGEKGSLHWIQQTGTSSFKSFRPNIVNYGCFESPAAFIQPSQGNFKRVVHMAQNSRLDVLQIFVDTTFADNTIQNLNFKSIDEAIKYVDQLGVTTCEFILAAGQTHFATTVKATFAGNVIFSSDGTASLALATGQWLVNGGQVEYRNVTVRGDDGAVILDGGGTVKFNGATTNMGLSTDSFVTIKSGQVDVINPTCVVGHFAKIFDSSASTGRIEVSGTLAVPVGTSIITTLSQNIEAILIADTNPTTGLWARGFQRRSTPFGAIAAGVWLSVNVNDGIEGGDFRNGVTLA